MRANVVMMMMMVLEGEDRWIDKVARGEAQRLERGAVTREAKTSLMKHGAVQHKEARLPLSLNAATQLLDFRKPCCMMATC